MSPEKWADQESVAFIANTVAKRVRKNVYKIGQKVGDRFPTQWQSLVITAEGAMVGVDLPIMTKAPITAV